MSQTMSDLIKDTLPRLTNAPKGISIYQAANSILSLIYKKLLDRSSDLLASGDLDLTISAFDYHADLPADFVSMAEKPKADDLFSDWSQNTVWMAGTVTSYNATTGVLIVVVNNLSQTIFSTLSDWIIAVAAVGQTLVPVGASSTTLSRVTGTQTLTINTGLTLPQGTYVYIFNGTVPVLTDPFPYDKRKSLQPTYLGDDEHNKTWWEWYGFWGAGFEPPCNVPHSYKIIGTTIYIRPKPIVDVNITGRYFAKPVDFTAPVDTIPWGLFYEVFREGVVRIILKGISIPDADPDFMLFMRREIDTVINSRYKELPDRRSSRKDFT